MKTLRQRYSIIFKLDKFINHIIRKNKTNLNKFQYYYKMKIIRYNTLDLKFRD